jgi:ABC-type uncharacterized transport system involved in gliding motility auxiliary subunit
MKTKESRRRIVLGLGTIIGAVVFLAIVAAIQYIAVRHPVRWDITDIGKYTLAPQSRKAVENFKKKGLPIKVLAFYESKELRQRARVSDLLDQYRDVYSEFTYSFIDPDKDRTLALKNKIDTYPTILIKAGGKEERITTVDEETVTNALLKLLRGEIKRIYFVKGHGELSPESTDPDGMSVAKDQIGKQNYKTTEIVLTRKPAVPDDAAMLVVAGPTIDLLDVEMEMIGKYLDKGGKLLVLLNPFKTPALSKFLKKYGFITTDDIVIDRMSRVFGGDYLMPVITTYIKFPITKNFKLASFFPEARSVRVPKTPSPDVDAKELALTGPVSWTISESQLKSGKADFDPKTGMKGPIPVMAVSTYTHVASPDKGKGSPADSALPPPTKARIVVIGSSQFASNKFFRLQGNGDLFMNTISWLAEEESLIAIRPKSRKARPVVLTGSQSTIMFVLPVVFVPLVWFLAGVVVYFLRRRTSAV